MQLFCLGNTLFTGKLSLNHVETKSGLLPLDLSFLCRKIAFVSNNSCLNMFKRYSCAGLCAGILWNLCVPSPVLPKCFQCDYFTGIVELVKKLGNSSFEREDEEVNIVLICPKDRISVVISHSPK